MNERQFGNALRAAQLLANRAYTRVAIIHGEGRAWQIRFFIEGDTYPHILVIEPQFIARSHKARPVCQSCNGVLAVDSIMGTHGLCERCVPSGFPLHAQV